MRSIEPCSKLRKQRRAQQFPRISIRQQHCGGHSFHLDLHVFTLNFGPHIHRVCIAGTILPVTSWVLPFFTPKPGACPSPPATPPWPQQHCTGPAPDPTLAAAVCACAWTSMRVRLSFMCACMRACMRLRRHMGMPVRTWPVLPIGDCVADGGGKMAGVTVGAVVSANISACVYACLRCTKYFCI